MRSIDGMEQKYLVYKASALTLGQQASTNTMNGKVLLCTSLVCGLLSFLEQGSQQQLLVFEVQTLDSLNKGLSIFI